MGRDRNPAGSPLAASRHGLIASLRDLTRLIGFARGTSRRRLVVAIALTALAALFDIASLALLQRAAFALLPSAGGAANGGVGAMVPFLVAALAGSVLRLLAQRQTVVSQYAITETLAVEAFRLLQNQDYAEYIRGGASEGFATFDRLQLVCFNALAPFIAGAAALLTVLTLSVAIVALYPVAAMLVLVVPLLLAVSTLRGGPSDSAEGLSNMARRRARLLSEARSAFRDVFLINGQDRMLQDFTALEHAFRRKQSEAILAAQSSRHGFEIAALIFALLALLWLPSVPANSRQLIPALGVLGLGALRLLPSLATLRSSLHLIRLHGDVTADVLTLLHRPLRDVAASAEAPRYDREITLHGVVVRRNDRPDTLRGLNLTIPRGARIGIVGASGTGKSTLLDLLCGAVVPEAGTLLIDGQPLTAANSAAWRDRIGVVSQSSVLLGRSLREVVTFPERTGEADTARFLAAIDHAGAGTMAKAFAKGLDTDVGEALATLSGGQRQRLALAHALYRTRDLLLLDEATAQLDNDSERAVIDAISSLPRDLSVVIVTHRLALLECCDETYLLADGLLQRTDPQLVAVSDP